LKFGIAINGKKISRFEFAKNINKFPAHFKNKNILFLGNVTTKKHEIHYEFLD
jgi:hypothetical protein